MWNLLLDVKSSIRRIRTVLIILLVSVLFWGVLSAQIPEYETINFNYKAMRIIVICHQSISSFNDYTCGILSCWPTQYSRKWNKGMKRKCNRNIAFKRSTVKLLWGLHLANERIALVLNCWYCGCVFIVNVNGNNLEWGNSAQIILRPFCKGVYTKRIRYRK